MDNNILFKDIKIKLPELRTWFDGREVYPSLQDLRLLMIFLSDPYKQFSGDELITLVDLPSKASLHTLVCRLRQLLDGKYIFAVRGWGYAFAKERDS